MSDAKTLDNLISWSESDDDEIENEILDKNQLTFLENIKKYDPNTSLQERVIEHRERETHQRHLSELQKETQSVSSQLQQRSEEIQKMEKRIKELESEEK